MQYLYGARIHGIQDYIFETNKLREIIGASEILEHICTKLLTEILGSNYREDQLLLGAAGNIRYLFTDSDQCQTVCEELPLKVKEYSDLLVLSQGVVKIEDNEISGNHLASIEEILKAQRNLVSHNFSAGLMGRVRARRTGVPAYKLKNYSTNDSEYLDQTTWKKQEHRNGHILINKISPEINKTNSEKRFTFPTELDQIASEANKRWIAVIHADGNSLSKRIGEVLSPESGKDSRKALRALSTALEQSTQIASQKALEEVISTAAIDEKSPIPFRPVILGGDDLTVIIRADLALAFTQSFLKYFEEETRNKFKEIESVNLKEGLTACAGIAFIKEKFPFHYAVEMAEELCDHAKHRAKAIDADHPPSCLMFYRIQDTYAQSYQEIISKELEINKKNNSQEKLICFDYGPYSVNNQSQLKTIDKLIESYQYLLKDGAPVGKIREWLAEVYTNPERAKQKLDRICHINPKLAKNLDLYEITLQSGSKERSMIYDLINLHAIGM